VGVTYSVNPGKQPGSWRSGYQCLTPSEERGRIAKGKARIKTNLPFKRRKKRQTIVT